ncbi:S-Ena type endospore appendage [Halobacillus yeomjeoni]|uniref:Endospore appendages core domain-containing protein n=1 Tax=Halobacillus yeomjeoni TaxID=311194 RepID=A0A931MTX3_9BACI|nr:S-Ena type endospore appendage [Halobacillus yeomjeoni]MBH0228855.1 hypothetical protein [Halobacillus yeomjeoni]
MGSCCCCPDRGGAGDFINDELCGNFTIACGDAENVWSSTPTDALGAPIGPSQPVIGTVSVFFDRGCATDLLVNVYDDSSGAPVLVSSFTVPDSPTSSTGNTRAQTITTQFTRVEIVCTDDGDPPLANCTGKFCINAHYVAS